MQKTVRDSVSDKRRPERCEVRALRQRQGAARVRQHIGSEKIRRRKVARGCRSFIRWRLLDLLFAQLWKLPLIGGLPAA
jgi:hypothetical protein